MSYHSNSIDLTDSLPLVNDAASLTSSDLEGVKKTRAEREAEIKAQERTQKAKEQELANKEFIVGMKGAAYQAQKDIESTGAGGRKNMVFGRSDADRRKER
jgi:hypothetical protein